MTTTVSGLQKSPARLGKGLSALFADSDPVRPDPSAKLRTLPIEQLAPSNLQPRKNFDKEQLQELADSIKEKGLLQPILARPSASKPNSYEIVAGERRWRAAQMAGLHDVPVIVKDIKDKEALEVALIENIQRADLSPMEEAESYQRLMDEFSYKAEALGEALGKSRAYVSNMLRLNGLPKEIKDLVRGGSLTAGHARAILAAKNPLLLAREIIDGGLSVRQAENLAKASQGEEKKSGFARAPRKGSAQAKLAGVKDADVLKLEREVSTWLGLKVKLTPSGTGKGGSLSIEYTSLDQLEDVLARLSRPVKMAG